MDRLLDNLFGHAVDAGRISLDDTSDEQMIGLSYLVPSAMSIKREAPIGDQDLRHAEMVALLSGIRLTDDEPDDPSRTVH